jgi:hypothetical protein
MCEGHVRKPAIGRGRGMVYHDACCKYMKRKTFLAHAIDPSPSSLFPLLSCTYALQPNLSRARVDGRCPPRRGRDREDRIGGF